MQFKWNLRNRMVVGYVGVSVIPMLIAAFFAISSFQTELHHEAEKTAEAYLAMAHGMVQDRADLDLDRALAIAADPTISKAVRDGRVSEMPEELGTFVRNSDLGFAAILDGDGTVLVASRPVDSFEPTSETLRSL
ncbi:MAG: hypothetical protein PF636_01675, partial [Actinomycetota bacterium]|nr:hypothetical protein [Actinomycetota bacterium]